MQTSYRAIALVVTAKSKIKVFSEWKPRLTLIGTIVPDESAASNFHLAGVS